MDAEEIANLEAMEKMAEGFARHDADTILGYFADDAVFDTSQGPHPWGERHRGLPAIRAAVEQVFATLPDIRFENPQRWVCGNRGVAEWTCRATTPKGRPMEVRGCDLFQFRNGLVVRKDTYFKTVVKKKD